VAGGYDVLLAHNTLYMVGANSHALGVGFADHPCPSDAM
jgi:hypothetical protein